MSTAFRSRRAAVVKANRWIIGGSSLMALLALVALFLKGPAILLALAAGVFALAGMAAARERRFPQLEATLIEADHEGVRDRGKLLVRRQDITQGFAFTLGDGCLVRLVRKGHRRPLDIVTWDEAEGRALLRALGLDASQTSAELRGLSFTGYLPRIATAAVTVLGFLTAQRLLGGLIGPVVPAFLGWFVMLLLITLPATVGTRVSIGVDGVHVRWLSWSRFYPFSRVKAVRPYEKDERHGFELELTSGEKRPILISKANEVELANLAFQRVEHAFQAYTEGAGGADVSAALARRNRSPAEWLQRLRALGAGANADMRTAIVSPERLWQIVDDPSATGADRASAAFALASRGLEEDRERVRVAAKRIVAPKLRIALEKTATADTTDAELAEALAELDAERVQAENRAR
jgi:hypothetical protein